MAQYTAIFTKPYEDGYENLPSQNTPITAETLNDKDDAIVNIETYLSENDIPSDAEGLSYDNTDSGLTADNVQSAIDEIVTDIPTTAEDIGYDNTDSGLTADNVQGAVDELADEKVDKTGVDVKTDATGQFNTITGGLMQSCVVDLEPIQSGSGTPSPSNVRAISGHTQVQVGNVGKNWLNPTLATTTLNGITCTNNGDGTYTVSGTATADVDFTIQSFAFPSYIIGKNVKMVGCPSGGSGNTYRLQIRGTSFLDTGSGIISSYNLTYTNNLQIRISSGTVCNNLVFKPMLTLDTSATYDDYEPYNPNSYTTTINLGGTYYGGTLDAVSGVLTVDRVRVDLATYSWSLISQNRWHTGSQADPKGSDAQNLNNISEKYESVSDGNLYNDLNLIGFVINSLRDIVVRNGSTTDTPTGYLVYELATPTTIQLTPKNLETLVGQNNVFAPLQGQTVEEVEFREVLAWDDVERAINVKLDLSSVAPVEYTDKASQSYNQKQLFIKDYKLCQALASISSGASFTENTNFKYTTLAEIIEPLIP